MVMPSQTKKDSIHLNIQHESSLLRIKANFKNRDVSKKDAITK